MSGTRLSTAVSALRRATTTVAANAGEMALLTYNVAGLPMLFSPSDPVANTPLISRLLNHYDVAVVQEDFSFHDELSASARHPYRLTPLPSGPTRGLGDGLGVFSRVPLSSATHVEWHECSGFFDRDSDCLTAKGFTVSAHTLSTGVVVDLYNVHFDSGDSESDIRTREAQSAQLTAYLRVRSKGHAVIVAGDTNMSREERALAHLVRESAVTDACTSLSCAHPSMIDRVLYRSSESVDLSPVTFTVDRRFVRKDGKDLSDHKAVGVVFRWARRAPASRDG